MCVGSSFSNITGEYAGRSHAVDWKRERRNMSMIFCARPTFIIDLGVVHQSIDHVVSLFKKKKKKQKKTTLYVACCYSLLPCMRYLRDHRPKSFSPFTLITVSNLGKRVHTQCELLLLRGFCFCFLFWLFSSTPDHVVTSPRGRFHLFGWQWFFCFVFSSIWKAEQMAKYGQ